MRKLGLILSLVLLGTLAYGDISSRLNLRSTDATVNTYPYRTIWPNGSLTDNGDGTVTVNVSTTSGGTPGGSPTQVQFNNGGAFGGSAGLTFDSTTLITSAYYLKHLLNVGAGSFDSFYQEIDDFGGCQFQWKYSNLNNPEGRIYLYDCLTSKEILNFSVAGSSTTILRPLALRGTVDISSGTTLGGQSGTKGSYAMSNGTGTTPSWSGSGTTVQYQAVASTTQFSTSATGFTTVSVLTLPFAAVNATDTIFLHLGGAWTASSYTTDIFFTITRDGVNLVSGAGILTDATLPTGAGALAAVGDISETIGDTNQHTYAVQIKCDNASTCYFPFNGLSGMLSATEKIP